MTKLNILVVEDDVDSARTTALLLSKMGHDVEVAHDGACAVDFASAHEPDLVLLDLGLPDFDGYEVVHRFRDQSWAQRPSMVVALTGWAREEDRRKAMADGFDDYLVKPVRPEVLEALVARMAAKRAESGSGRRR